MPILPQDTEGQRALDPANIFEDTISEINNATTRPIEVTTAIICPGAGECEPRVHELHSTIVVVRKTAKDRRYNSMQSTS